MNRSRPRLWLALSLGTALLAGCAAPAPSSSGGSVKPASATLSVKGSDTMVQLAQAWAQAFMQAHPEISVTVTGGGSNTGIAALMNKGTDIADASRPMKPEEKQLAKESGLDVHEFVVGRDALSIVVNPSNPVSEITLDQLKDLYTGKITNWKQLGGPDKAVVLNGRESSSGTYVFFQERVLRKQPYAASVLQQPATSQVVDTVVQDAGGIGYVGLGYVSPKVKALKVKKDASSPGVEANVENVVNGSYALARPLFEYTAQAPSGSVKTWLDWVQGPSGQELVKKLGFVPAK